MKAFVIVLLCVLAAVQGRFTAPQNNGNTPVLGENPWFLHLRIAVSTSGLLNTGAGSLIDNRWVLTSAANVVNARFIWVRYGFVDVINPSLVTESTINAVRIHPEYDAATGTNNIALINTNRFVQKTDYIAPIPFLGEPFGGPAWFCNVGEKENGAPGEHLNCYQVGVGQKEDYLVISNHAAPVSTPDYGAPLVSNGRQVGLLVGEGSGSYLFQPTPPYKEWIGQETGLFWYSEAVAEVASEAVRFIQ